MASSKPYNAMKAAQGAARAAHFKAGKTVAMWRGRSSKVADAKKVASKNACRGKVSE